MTVFLLTIYVTVGMDKPLARLIVVRRLSVEKDQVLPSGILDTSFLLHVLPLKNSVAAPVQHHMHVELKDHLHPI